MATWGSSRKARPRTQHTQQIKHTSHEMDNTGGHFPPQLEPFTTDLYKAEEALTVQQRISATSATARDVSEENKISTVEFFARPLSTVSWLEGDFPSGRITPFMAIGSQLGDGADWVRVIQLELEEDWLKEEINEEDYSRQLTLKNMSNTVVGGAVRALHVGVSKRENDSNVILCGTETGQMHRIDSYLEDMEFRISSQVFCEFLEPVVGIAQVPFREEIVAVGERGTISLYKSMNGTKEIQRCTEAEPISFTDVCSVSESLIATSGRTGFVLCFDVRQPLTKSVQRLPLASTGVFGTCITVDYGQPNYIFAGSSEGELVLWDRRTTSDMASERNLPIFRIAAHHGRVSDVKVSPIWNPNVAFTCGSVDSQILRWDFATAAQSERTSYIRRSDGKYSMSPWEANIQREHVTNITKDSVFSVNAMDIHSTTPLITYVSSSSSISVVCL